MRMLEIAMLCLLIAATLGAGAAVRPLYQDSFATGDLKAWTLQPPIDALGKIPPNGSWAVENGALVATGTATPWTIQTAGDPSWANYRFSTKITIRKPTPKMEYPVLHSEYDRYFPRKDFPPRCEHSGQFRYHYYAGEFDWGSDAAVYVRYQDRNACYRIQLSTEYQEMILWHGIGGYLQVVPCKLQPGKTYQLDIVAQGAHLQVSLDGKKTIDYWHECLPSLKGGIGLAAYSSTVAFQDVKVTALPAHTAPQPAHQEKFSTRTWRSQRWVFDGNEPILLLEKESTGLDSYAAKSLYYHFVKLRPGYRPAYLGWITVLADPHAPQLEGDEWTGIKSNGEGGNRLTLDFDAVNPEQTLRTHHTDVVTYDRVRGTYRHDITANLTFLKDTKRNLLEFLDPLTYNNKAPGRGVKYGWLTEHEWGVYSGQDGKLYRHPIAESFSLEGQNGFKAPKDHSFWMLYPERAVCPAWETNVPGESAFYEVCHWGYDYHHRFMWYDKPHTYKANETLLLNYSLVGYPPEEAERLFQQAAIGPQHLKAEIPEKMRNLGLVPSAYAFPVAEPAGNDFTILHNTITPFTGWQYSGDYTIDNAVGHNDHYSLRLDGPGTATGMMYHHMLDLYAQKYLCTAWVKTKGVRGGRGVIIKLKYSFLATPCDTVETGITGDTDWQQISFITTVPLTHDSTDVIFQLDGMGIAWIDDFSLRGIEDGETPVEYRGKPVAVLPAPSTDYLLYAKCDEGEGKACFDSSNHGNSLKLTGVTWVNTGKRAALHFEGNAVGFISNLSPELRQKTQAPYNYPGAALTIDAWVRPTAGKGGGAIIGYMASPMLYLSQGNKGQFILNLMTNPAGKSVTVSSQPIIPADQWTHVAAVIDKDHNARLYINGKPAGEKALGGNIAYSAWFRTMSIGTYGKFYGYQYTGDLAELRWWSRAATEAEIAAAAATAP
ncbi:MAG: LamG-like jellyroll fold domain-containing protein [Armatimonadota bacterium]